METDHRICLQMITMASKLQRCQLVKKTTEDGRMERATRLKLERWKDDGVKETTNRCVTDEELQAWKMKKAKAESLQSKELGDYMPSALTGLYIPQSNSQ